MKKTMYSKIKNFLFIPLLSMCLLLNGTPSRSEDNAGYDAMYARIKAELKEEIYQEIKGKLRDEINEDMRAMIEEEVALFVSKQNYWTRQRAASNFKHPEMINASTRRIVQQLIPAITAQECIPDSRLDMFVGGKGVQPDVQIGAGFATSTDPLYAAKPGYVDETEYDTEGGEEELQGSIEQALRQRGSILLPKGTLQGESSTTWAHLSTNRINIQGFSILPVLVIGDISTENVKRDIFIQNFALKYGLLNNLQTEIKFPLRGQYERVTVTDTSEDTRSKFGIGDIELGVSRQIGWEGGYMPDLIAALSVKAPTGKSPYNRTIGLGTGHWAAKGSLIAAKASDPAVVFGSLSYTWNFQRNNIDNYGDIKPGNTIGYSIGTAIALSYQTAINFSFDHSITQKTKRDDRYLTGSFINSASIKIGSNWAVNENLLLDFGVSFGVTDDAPDVSVELRVPYTF